MASYTDPFMRMIELMGKLLGSALNNLLKLKGEGRIIDAIESTRLCFENELHIDFEKLMSMQNEELIDYLKTKNIHQQHLENFAKLLIEYAEITNNNNLKLYEKAQYLLNYINQQDKTFSIERQNYLNKIKQHISQ